MLLDKMQHLSERLISKYGDKMTVVLVERGTYDPVSGEVSRHLTKSETKGLIESFTSIDLANESINNDDLKITITTQDLYRLPMPKDEIQIQGSTLQIISVKVITIQDGIVICTIQVRR